MRRLVSVALSIGFFAHQSLAELTQGKEKTLPILLRYLMGAFGSKEQSRDLLSFLLFESDYCKTLIDIGYQDAIAQKNDIKDFFEMNRGGLSNDPSA